VIETKEIVLDDLPDLAGRLDRIRAIAIEIERAPDETYAPLAASLRRSNGIRLPR
jgi:hypothetical protein